MSRLLGMLCCLLATPSLAGVDPILLEDGRWRVIGIAAGAEPEPIAVTRDDAALGDFAALGVEYDLGAGFVRVLELDADGTIEPRLPPPAEPGATAVLGRYFECDGGLTAPLRFAALELPEQAGSSLQLRGTLSNLDSLVSDKLRLHVLAPDADRLRVTFAFKLRATRDLCVDPERRDTQEEFRIVELRSRFLSPAEHLSDLARYTKAFDLDCDGFDCDVDEIRFCAALENVTGYVIHSPKRLHDRELALFHTSNVPEPTPTLTIEMSRPRPRAVIPQGFVTQSSDPGGRNVAFWADWVEVKRRHDVGRTVGSFSFALEATEPRNPSCDRRQD